LQEFARRLAIEAGRQMEYYRHLDNERIEDLISHWLPIARPASESFDDLETALKASYVVLNAIERRLKILFGGGPEQSTKAVAQADILVWLQSALAEDAASTKKALVLESDAEKLQ
jgi:hypothetical protein